VRVAVRRLLAGLAATIAGREPMQREPGFLEVMAMVCTVITAILAIADWMLRLNIV